MTLCLAKFGQENIPHANGPPSDWTIDTSRMGPYFDYIHSSIHFISTHKCMSNYLVLVPAAVLLTISSHSVLSHKSLERQNLFNKNFQKNKIEIIIWKLPQIQMASITLSCVSLLSPFL